MTGPPTRTPSPSLSPSRRPATARPRRRPSPLPANASTGASTSPTLSVHVSDPDSDPLTVTFFGRPLASGNYTQIAAEHERHLEHRLDHQRLGQSRWRPDVPVVRNRQGRDPHRRHRPHVDVPHHSRAPTPSSSAPATSRTAVAPPTSRTPRRREPWSPGSTVTFGQLGDNVYQSGTASEFANCYDQVWGGFKSRTRPVPGNHDWNSGNLDGYNGYFGANATDVAARATTATTSRRATGTSSTSTANARR